MRDDIACAKSKMASSFGSKREIRLLERHLSDGERVERMGSGEYGPGSGLIVLTNLRVQFVRDRPFSKRVEDMPLRTISSVKWSAGRLIGSLTISASGSSAEIRNVPNHDGELLANAIRRRTTPIEG